MKGDAHKTPKICAVCKRRFYPKSMGYNAIYCGRNCKVKSFRLRRPDIFKAARRRSYLSTKANKKTYSLHLKSNRISVRKCRVWLAEFKMKSGCVDCGFKTHPAALQLDHEGPKTAAISYLRSSVKRMLAEIETGKCVVRCANCHSVRTWAQKNKLIYKPGMTMRDKKQ